MKTVFLSAVLASTLVGMSQARADELYVMTRTAPGSEWVCGLSPNSFPDMFRLFSEYNASINYPQPQIDYTTGAPIHATIIHNFDYQSGKPMVMVFFTEQDYCKAAAISANKVQAARR